MKQNNTLAHTQTFRREWTAYPFLKLFPTRNSSLSSFQCGWSGTKVYRPTLLHIPCIPTPTTSTTVFTALQLGTPLCRQPHGTLADNTEGLELRSDSCPEECPDKTVLGDGFPLKKPHYWHGWWS